MGSGPLRHRVAAAFPVVEVSPVWPHTRTLITQGCEAPTRRHARATIPWARKKHLHIFNTYSHDASYEDRVSISGLLADQAQLVLAQIGRVPCILAVSFNQEPSEPVPD